MVLALSTPPFAPSNPAAASRGSTAFRPHGAHHVLLPHAARLLACRAPPLPRTAAAARLRPLRMSAFNHSGAGASSPSAPSPPPALAAATATPDAAAGAPSTSSLSFHVPAVDGEDDDEDVDKFNGFDALSEYDAGVTEIDEEDEKALAAFMSKETSS
ncbi:uncharacterized protein [Aegilops tauschii subsp. strangulata]|nr:formin-like protein 18 [Aegilops tauschii subsp. strangulata]XP_040246882.1 formin-like protein 18 [Aegilops tauschii subsp. strangulata]XP_040246883.1 formin-like protein 18 [Aegilops tauschii subsp. strangulata]XP_040246884.1 formin-like protein 18 [Aegilops tauschii subsp. strangulata]XP_040246885.1 formin-like protein 18 [Aegilops tauschii subsp. strangulata]XP_045085150.1 formin-like protein 18 [Aegilops tauschii subsp. strangulata]